MLAKVFSGAVYGVDAYTVEIEVNSGHGEPKTLIVGLPDTAVKESEHRVNTALLNSGFMPPKGRVTINLAPKRRVRVLICRSRWACWRPKAIFSPIC